MAMAIILYIVYRVLRRNPATKSDEFHAIVDSEFGRAKRLGKQVALIEIEFESHSDVDLVGQLTIDRLLIRDYDHISLYDPKKYLLLWPDCDCSLQAKSILELVKWRLTGIRGLRRFGVALYPVNGDDFEALIKVADND